MGSHHQPKCLRVLVTVLFLMILHGCAPPIPVYQVARKVLKDLEPDQPWLGPDIKAEAYMTHVAYSLGSSEVRLEWVDHKKHTVAKAHKVIVQCQKYLDKQGLWDTMRGDRIELLASPQRSYLQELLVTPTRDRYFLSEIDKNRENVYGFEDVLVIVCLDPVVVIQGPEAIRNYAYLPGYLRRTGNSNSEGAYYFLPWGFSYGTIVPYAKDPVWFSPDMKQGPQAAAYVDENTREIVVPWGKLILIREGDNWIVHTQKAK